jgi:hypothetical protein
MIVTCWSATISEAATETRNYTDIKPTITVELVAKVDARREVTTDGPVHVEGGTEKNENGDLGKNDAPETHA